jgi:hypothetical protein
VLRFVVSIGLGLISKSGAWVCSRHCKNVKESDLPGGISIMNMKHSELFIFVHCICIEILHDSMYELNHQIKNFYMHLLF